MKKKCKQLPIRGSRIATFFLFLLLVVLFMPSNILMSVNGDNSDVNIDDEETHNVSVKAHLVPFYAEDKDGNPIYDLTQDEIELWVNKKEFPIMAINSFRFDTVEQAEGDELEEEEKELEPMFRRKKVGRYIFIIIDYMFNSPVGLKRANEVSWDIIKHSAPEDAFTIMENIPEEGIAYVEGPTNDRKRLEEAFEKVHERGMNSITKQYMNLKHWGAGMGYARNGVLMHQMNASASQVLDIHGQEDLNSKIHRAKTLKARALMLTQSIVQLRHALSTISRPKMVYLISSGVNPSIITQRSLRHYHDLLVDAAQKINRSGSLLYVIDSSIKDPAIKKHFTGEDSLKMLAKGGNGKYFSGNDLKKLSQQIRKSTSAYYELAFSPDTNKRMDIEIRALRPGIKIFTVSQTEQARPYSQLKELQRNLYALSVVTGGAWSRTSGTVRLLPFTKVENEGNQDKTTVRFSIPIPDIIKDKPLDIYMINIDPKTQEAEFKIRQLDLMDIDRVELSGQTMENRWLYFVIIEPQSATCLFNRVH